MGQRGGGAIKCGTYFDDPHTSLFMMRAAAATTTARTRRKDAQFEVE
jgi:hypothetical protein